MEEKKINLPTQCPDCKGELEKGVLLDHTYGQVAVQRYAKGDIADIKKSNPLWFTEEAFYDVRRTMALRCTQCNRLFIYALRTIQIKDVNARKNTFWLIAIIFAVIYVLILGSFILSRLNTVGGY